MADIGQYLYNWYDLKGNPNTSLPPERTIEDNLVSDPNGWTKVGIKAPVGTRVKINDNIFVIGPSGTLHINKEGYIIKSLSFIKDYIVIKDVDAIDASIKNGMENIDKALSNFINQGQITIIKNENDIVETETTYAISNINQQQELSGIYAEFLKNFIEGYNEFSQGVSGVYKVQTENGNPQKQELYNILIDYEIKEENSNG